MASKTVGLFGNLSETTTYPKFFANASQLSGTETVSASTTIGGEPWVTFVSAVSLDQISDGISLLPDFYGLDEQKNELVEEMMLGNAYLIRVGDVVTTYSDGTSSTRMIFDQKSANTIEDQILSSKYSGQFDTPLTYLSFEKSYFWQPDTTSTLFGTTTETKWRNEYYLVFEGGPLKLSEIEPLNNPLTGRLLIASGDPNGQRTDNWGNWIDFFGTGPVISISPTEGSSFVVYEGYVAGKAEITISKAVAYDIQLNFSASNPAGAKEVSLTSAIIKAGTTKTTVEFVKGVKDKIYELTERVGIEVTAVATTGNEKIKFEKSGTSTTTIDVDVKDEVLRYLEHKGDFTAAAKIAGNVQEAKGFLGEALKLVSQGADDIVLINALKKSAQIISTTLDVGSIIKTYTEEVAAAKGSPNAGEVKLLASLHATIDFFDLAVKTAFTANSAVFVAGVIEGLALTSVAAPILITVGAGVATYFLYEALSPYVKEMATDVLLKSYETKLGPLSLLESKDGEKTIQGNAGNNLFSVSVESTAITEGAKGGFDTVLASSNFKLSANVEALILTGPALNGVGNALNNQILGNLQSNRIDGDRGADYLSGAAGADKLLGGLGADDLYGGAGKDMFIFKTIADSTVSIKGRDTIFDFSVQQHDHIDLRAIDANTAITANQAFTFIGSTQFHGKAGELRIAKLASDTYVYGDTNGDKKSDFTVHLDDAINLTKLDFFL